VNFVAEEDKLYTQVRDLAKSVAKNSFEKPPRKRILTDKSTVCHCRETSTPVQASGDAPIRPQSQVGICIFKGTRSNRPEIILPNTTYLLPMRGPWPQPARRVQPCGHARAASESEYPFSGSRTRAPHWSAKGSEGMVNISGAYDLAMVRV
jgi:hypothetical protein